MVKIKICGLSRACDIDYVNALRPDYAGFVIHYPKSKRNVSTAQLQFLRERLLAQITPVGVFVDEPVESVAKLLNSDLISIAQLHGTEDEYYIQRLRALTDRPLIQAFTVHSGEDVLRARASSADYILLDQGKGGGKQFDWNLARDIDRPWFLAGGLTPENLAEAIRWTNPTAVDLSSGVETDGYKDKEKIASAINVCREHGG